MTLISVCIATYNGERFIKQQLESILNQLGSNDEIIISDDSSTDNTLNIIREFDDSRIHVYVENKFRSPISNFEFCISKAQGDIIFLSDQDDLWMPTKVEEVCSVFQKNCLVSLVSSNAMVIDENNEVIKNRFFQHNFKFTSSIIQNIIKNRFLGCTLAFRGSMKNRILPFPPRLPMHDMWIGIICKLFGDVYFIDKPLIAYRRHASNFTPKSHASPIKMFYWRFNLLIALFIGLGAKIGQS